LTRAAHSPWYSRCRRAQERWKATTPLLVDDARFPGHTWVEGRGGPIEVGPFPVCLPTRFADHNLLPSVRQEAIDRFAGGKVAWHHGTPGPAGVAWPSSHLLDSQVQCVNVLLSLPRPALLGLVRAVEPAATGLADVEGDSPVAFEWCGLIDHLGERRGRPVTRGRYCTSADALMIAVRADGGRTGVIVEWKFTESYDRPIAFIGAGGTDRREVYRARYEAAPFLHHPPIEVFFHEPHYQLLRLVLLAHAMVAAGEHGIDRAVVVHAVPAGNDTLLRTVPEGLASFGATVPEVWTALVGGGPVGWASVDTARWIAASPEAFSRYGHVMDGAAP
jgi:hypothetical protein